MLRKASKYTVVLLLAVVITVGIAGNTVIAYKSYRNPQGYPMFGEPSWTCKREDVSVEYKPNLMSELPASVCYGKTVDVAYASNGGGRYIRIHSPESSTYDGHFEQLYNTDYMAFFENDMLIIRHGALNAWGYRAQILITDDIKTALTPNLTRESDGHVYGYKLDLQKMSPIISEGSQDMTNVTKFSISNNGRYMLNLFPDKTVHILDRENGHDRVVAQQDLTMGTLDNPGIFGAISNDGANVFLAGWDRVLDCSDIATPCIVGNQLSHMILPANIVGARFSDDGQSLELVLSNLVGYYLIHSTEDYIEDDANPPSLSLSYLALGDSFSSGEGDLSAGSSGYRWGTNVDGSTLVPQEKCHISTSSYPYKLASSMNYGKFSVGASMTWSSVACSGAVIDDISESDSSEYKGQGNRLVGFNVEKLKTEALNDMTPGRQKQIEFVKKYKPKAVTITAGGNDIQFSKIINACVNPVGYTGEWSTTCSYAKDNEKKANIAYGILDQRDRLVSLYRELIQAGDSGMKLYVEGYPIFLNKDAANSVCGASVRLNNDEREMAVESTKFLNQIIRSAAEEAGAIYIDTETSFGDHVLCGPSEVKAVNGIILNDISASFHPNQYGHSLLALRIMEALNGKALGDYICKDSAYVSCPGGNTLPVTIPNYFKQAINENIKSTIDHNIISDIVNAPGKAFIWIGDHTVGADNPIDVIIYSDKKVIGTYTANQSGGFSGEITLPQDLPYGYHTLELVSKDEQGKPVKLCKIFEYRSANPDDYDGDGILNDKDENQYYDDSPQETIQNTGNGEMPKAQSVAILHNKQAKQNELVSANSTNGLSNGSILGVEFPIKSSVMMNSTKQMDVRPANNTNTSNLAIPIGVSVMLGAGLMLWQRKRRNAKKTYQRNIR